MANMIHKTVTNKEMDKLLCGEYPLIGKGRLPEGYKSPLKGQYNGEV